MGVGGNASWSRSSASERLAGWAPVSCASKISAAHPPSGTGSDPLQLLSSARRPPNQTTRLAAVPEEFMWKRR